MQLYEVMFLLDGHDKIGVGLFSTIENARRAIEAVQDQPGFREDRAGFVILPYRVEADDIKSLYEVSVIYHTLNDSFEYSERLGFFSGLADARASASLFRKINRKRPKHMHRTLYVSRCLVDRIGWVDGFDWE